MQVLIILFTNHFEHRQNLLEHLKGDLLRKKYSFEWHAKYIHMFSIQVDVLTAGASENWTLSIFPAMAMAESSFNQAKALSQFALRSNGREIWNGHLEAIPINMAKIENFTLQTI